MKDIAEQLLQEKKKLQAAKEQDISIRGKIAAMMETLKKSFDCDTIEQAQQKLNQMQDDIGVKQLKLEKALKEFQRKYAL